MKETGEARFGEWFEGMGLAGEEKFWQAELDALTKIEAVQAPSEEAFCVLDRSLGAAAAYVTESRKLLAPSLLSALQALHGLLFSPMFAASTKREVGLQNKISQLCELWWKQGRPSKETVMPQTITFLLIQALEPSSKKADIVRIHAMREALLLLDFDDQSSDTLKHLLLRCVIHPLIVRVAEGRRFLSFLFQIHGPFLEHIFLAIKNQLPYSRISVVEAYGDILLRAWQHSPADLKDTIEASMIQPLMHSAVHCASDATTKAVRKVLQVFHDHKQQRGVDGMLCRLYTPILWRAMNVANPLVRRNAVTLFIAAFPLRNPDSPLAETEANLQKQLDQLRSLLDDTDLPLRLLAVQGVCRVIGLYWEVIPSEVTKALLAKLLSDLVFDSTSSAVRAAVFEGLTFVLDNHLSHHMLKGVLPELRQAVFDGSPRVQAAVIDLLLAVKRVRNIKFFHIVTIDQLLVRLQVGCQRPVAVRIAELLMNSFFPFAKSPAVQLRRVLWLFRHNVQAGRTFLAHVYSHVPPGALYRLVVILYRFLLHASRGGTDQTLGYLADTDVEEADPEDTTVTTTTGKAGKKAKSARASTKTAKAGRNNNAAVDPEGEPEPLLEKGSALWTDDQPIVEALLGAMALLWRQADDRADSESIPERAVAIRAMTGDLGKGKEDKNGGLQELVVAFSSAPARLALLGLAGHLPSGSFPQLQAASIDQLSALPLTAQVNDYGPLLDCLTHWGRFSQVIEMLSAGVGQGLSSTESSRGKGKSGRVLNPELTLKYLTYIMEHTRTRGALLHSLVQGESQSKEGKRKKIASIPSTSSEALKLLDQLKQAVFQLESRLNELNTSSGSNPDAGPSLSFLADLFSVYWRLRLHLYALVSTASLQDDKSTNGEDLAGELHLTFLSDIDATTAKFIGVVPHLDTTYAPPALPDAAPAKKRKGAESVVTAEETPTKSAQRVTLFWGKFLTEVLTLGFPSPDTLSTTGNGKGSEAGPNGVWEDCLWPARHAVAWANKLPQIPSQGCHWLSEMWLMLYKLAYRIALRVPFIAGAYSPEAELVSLLSVILKSTPESLALESGPQSVVGCLGLILQAVGSPANSRRGPQSDRTFTAVFQTLALCFSEARGDEAVGFELPAISRMIASAIAHSPVALELLPLVWQAPTRTDDKADRGWEGTLQSKVLFLHSVAARVLTDSPPTATKRRSLIVKALDSGIRALEEAPDSSGNDDSQKLVESCRELLAQLHVPPPTKASKAAQPIDMADDKDDEVAEVEEATVSRKKKKTPTRKQKRKT